MTQPFDLLIDRRCTDSIKWNAYPAEVLPLWVADMDFRSPEPVIAALTQRVSHGIFGYPCDPKELRQLLVQRMQRLYQWEIKEEDILFIPGVVTALNQACHAFTEPGDGILVQPPIYHPILWVNRNAGLTRDDVPLVQGEDGAYEIDFEQFEAGIKDSTKLFILCNPHNPVGRVFRREELSRLAEICLKHDVMICSDEIHCDLVFSGHTHTPIASLSPEIAAKTITLMAPSKTFNLAGLACSYAIVPNPDLRSRLAKADEGMGGHVNLLGYTAAAAALQHGQDWLDDLLVYLHENRRILVNFVREELPGIKIVAPEGTYMAWLDCRELGLDQSPGKFFEKYARVGMNDGSMFGPGGEGFTRINFGCPRTVLLDALERMKMTLSGI